MGSQEKTREEQARRLANETGKSQSYQTNDGKLHFVFPNGARRRLVNVPADFKAAMQRFHDANNGQRMRPDQLAAKSRDLSKTIGRVEAAKYLKSWKPQTTRANALGNVGEQVAPRETLGERVTRENGLTEEIDQLKENLRVSRVREAKKSAREALVRKFLEKQRIMRELDGPMCNGLCGGKVSRKDENGNYFKTCEDCK